MSKVAILVDGGFYRKRAKLLAIATLSQLQRWLVVRGLTLF